MGAAEFRQIRRPSVWTTTNFFPLSVTCCRCRGAGVGVEGVTDMGSHGYGPVVLMWLVILFLATGSSARDAVRVPSAEPSVTIVHSPRMDRPWAIQADIRERQMLEWIILLLKDGRSGR